MHSYLHSPITLNWKANIFVQREKKIKDLTLYVCLLPLIKMLLLILVTFSDITKNYFLQSPNKSSKSFKVSTQ